ncbi:MAG: hypothetical protein DYG96_10075 [Chlorobi bacterium CHB2]|nr:hypothetical protein [Chlorobi bacterium CHB2]
MKTTINAILRFCMIPAVLTAMIAAAAIAQPTQIPLSNGTQRPKPTRDITATGDFRIVGATQTFGVNYGGTITLKTSDLNFVASTKKYSMNMVYTMTNNGNAGTGLFNNRLVDNGVGISGVTGQSLNAGQTKAVTHAKVQLSEGTHVITLMLDDANSCAETDEGNNTFKVTVVIVP